MASLIVPEGGISCYIPWNGFMKRECLFSNKIWEVLWNPSLPALESSVDYFPLQPSFCGELVQSGYQCWLPFSTNNFGGNLRYNKIPLIQILSRKEQVKLPFSRQLKIRFSHQVECKTHPSYPSHLPSQSESNFPPVLICCLYLLLHTAALVTNFIILNDPEEHVDTIISFIDTNDAKLQESVLYSRVKPYLIRNSGEYLALPITVNLVLMVANVLACWGALTSLSLLIVPWLLLYLIYALFATSLLVYMMVLLQVKGETKLKNWISAGLNKYESKKDSPKIKWS